MPQIKVTNLSKIYSIYERREGVWGSVKDLMHREYQPLKAVDNISFEIAQGELVGFIGPNGAGKSTTIKMLTGILKPTSGEIDSLTFNPYIDRKAYVNHIGVVFGQRTQLWWDIAVIESYKLLKHIYRVPQDQFKKNLDLLTEILNLKEILHKPVRKLSLGQRLKADLAGSLLHSPNILFLDEPTIGVDAVAKVKIRNFLRTINQELQTTILLTTHDLNEIEELSKRLIIIDAGSIVYDGDISQILNNSDLQKELTIDFLQSVNPNDIKQKLLPDISISHLSETKLTVSIQAGTSQTIEVIKSLLENFPIADISLRDPDIEDVIMQLYSTSHD